MSRAIGVSEKALAAALVLLTGVWAWYHVVGTQRSERAAMTRHAHSLAQGLSVLVERVGAQDPANDARLRSAVEAHLRLRPPFLFAVLQRGDAVVLEVGDRGDGVTLAPGVSADGRLVVTRTPLLTHSKGDPTAPRAPWWWVADTPEQAGALSVVIGMHGGLPPRARRALVTRVAATLALAWLAIAALVFALARTSWARALAVELQAERRERALLGEMNLAAAGLAHETRNPLGIIHGLAQQLAADADLEPHHDELAEQIMDEADRAAARLSDFINYARLPEPKVEPTSMAALLSRIVTTLSPDFEQAGVELSLACPRVRVRCDGGMVEQVVVNLLLNSLRASAAGSHTRVTLAVESTRETRATLTVRDEGRGVAPERLEAIFEPYVSDHPGGHGLGLAIVKRIVEQHGWTVTLGPAPPRGTRVVVAGLQVAGSDEEAS